MIYAYKCPVHGEFDREFPMGSAPPSARCPWSEESKDEHGQMWYAICEKTTRRVFSTSALIMGPGFKKPWADKVQTSDELQDHFRRKR